MPRGAKPGEIRNPKGKPKGTPNKKTLEVAEKLARMGCDSIVGMATIALNNLPCGVCRSTGITRYKLEAREACICEADPKDCGLCLGTGFIEWGERVCQSCWGTLYEACSPELRGKMYSDLAQYQHAKRKAIEHSGSIGMPDVAAVMRERYEKRKEQNG